MENIKDNESFSAFHPAKRYKKSLGKRANLSADGRPIIGLSAKELLDLALNVSERAILIPAHVWTPWFSLYGSNSGFDSIEECFGDLAKYIYAIETGLSSDPAMNWRIKDLDNKSIVSFSDAHSAPKMGRELTIFDTDLSYDGILEALKKERIAMTIEFFPEEGKYHFTGHRNCDIRHSPEETAKKGVACPKCHKQLTVGVMHRVDVLAEVVRKEGYVAKSRPKYKSLVPLQEIISEAIGVPVTSDKVKNSYSLLTKEFSSEMSVLIKEAIQDIEKVAGNSRIAQGVDKVRRSDIDIEPGYDGVFGVVKIWPDSKQSNPIAKRKIVRDITPQAEGQKNLFEN